MLHLLKNSVKTIGKHKIMLSNTGLGIIMRACGDTIQQNLEENNKKKLNTSDAAPKTFDWNRTSKILNIFCLFKHAE